jgi:lysophospholipase L1-like esterase
MRESFRRRLTGVAVALSAAAALAGCFGGGGQPTRAKAVVTNPAASPSPSAKPTPAWDTHPASLAALGDSITRGFDACGVLTDCPNVSWATGGSTSVDSVASRLLADPAADSWNLAESGARMSELTGQVEQAVAKKPEQVTILMGANDACRNSVAAMTPVADYRREFEDAMAVLHRRLPKAQVLVASIPDLKRLWSVGRENPLGRQVWKLGLCQSMLADPDSTSVTADSRRNAVRDQVVAYNAVLKDVCGRYTKCRYDGGAVFDYSFTTAELSPWDWFHPSTQGQAGLAGIVYRAITSSTTVVP